MFIPPEVTAKPLPACLFRVVQEGIFLQGIKQLSMNQQEAEVILKVNDQQARDKFNELEKKTKDLRQQFAEAFSKGDSKSIDAINKKLQQTTKEMNNMRTNAANIRAALVNLDKATSDALINTNWILGHTFENNHKPSW